MAAPTGNRFALGNEGGRPAHYNTPQELHTKIMDYFKWVDDENKGRTSITGLCLFLGFERLPTDGILSLLRRRKFSQSLRHLGK